MQTRYATINKELKSYKRIEKNLLGFSAQGGSFEAFLTKDGQLRKINVIHYGEMGKAKSDYYYWDNSLFFVLESLSSYDQPFGKVTQVEENRYYLNNGKLIRWIDPKGVQQSLSNPEFLEVQKRLLKQEKLNQKILSSPGNEVNAEKTY